MQANKAKEAERLIAIQATLRALADQHDSGKIFVMLADITSPREVEIFLNWDGYPYERCVEQRERLHKLGIWNDSAYRIARKALLDLNHPDPEALRRRQIADLSRELVGRAIPGYFPTPRLMARVLAETMELRPGLRVLEPSAGKGDLADAILAACPDVDLAVCEVNHTLRQILELKGYRLLAYDCLALKDVQFDRILMNPSFEDGADMAHVRAMYDLLAPGGKLVSIMAPTWTRASERRKVYQNFRTFVEDHGGYWHANEDGAFLTSDRPTSMSTILLHLDKE